jgi:hypothetical protein
MLSGAAWVRDQVAGGGWTIEIAEVRKVKAIAPLTCQTDRVDARVLARRDLVPDVWVPSLDDRAIPERVRWRSHLIGCGPQLSTAASGGSPSGAAPQPGGAPARRARRAGHARRARGLAALERHAAWR